MHDALPLDIDGPVQAEIFVLWLHGDRLELTGPCGPEPWLVELGSGEHPLDTAARIARANLGSVRLLHSTSWRRDREAVILTFVAIIDAPPDAAMASAPVARADLARSQATAAPAEIGWRQVLEHGLRHLAWLAREDPAVRQELSPAWHEALAGYVPEPFRALA
jgi:hypothetical protein